MGHLTTTHDEAMDRSARWMAGSMLVLLGLGVVMVASASGVQDLRASGDLVVLKGHLVKVMVAIAAFLVAQRVTPHLLYRLAWPTWLLSVLLLMAVLVVGIKVKGARRWLDLGAMTFQPSELARMATILAVGAWAAAAGRGMERFKTGVLVPLAIVGVPAVLIIMEPDFGSTVYLLFMGVLTLWVGGARVVHLMGAFAATLGAAALYGASRLAHVSRRVDSFTDPEPGSQVWQGLVALGRGHVDGVGLGEGLGTWGFVPEAENDFILAVIGEELGLLGTLGVVGLYVLFLLHGVRLLLGLRTRFAVVVGAGLLFQVVVQALLNIAVVTAVAPPKGLPLPFVSAGGSSLMILSVSAGLLLGLARHAKQDPIKEVRWSAADASGRGARMRPGGIP